MSKDGTGRAFVFLFAGTLLLLPLGSSAQPLHRFVDFSVPFTPQAPFGQWSDPRQESACEEASVLMAMAWVKATSLNPAGSLSEILGMAAYEAKQYGDYRDTSAADTVERLFQGYFHYSGAQVRYDANAAVIRDALDAGNLVLVPVDGRKLGNPFFRRPGPERHMLLIRGYDRATGEFITNDAGTRRGKEYRYRTRVVESAMHNYPTSGAPQTVKPRQGAIIVVRRGARLE